MASTQAPATPATPAAPASPPAPAGRAPRSDAARNREQLLAAATRVLASAESGSGSGAGAGASADAGPSMRAIAKEAGVGIATLYRNFPTRESLVEAVYRDQVTRLTTGARELLASETPAVALRRWMDLFGDWIATKSGMLATLLSMVESGDLAHAQTREQLLEAISTILDAGVTAGELRPDVTADDLSAALIGIFTVAHQASGAVDVEKLLDVLLDGLRAQRPR